MKVIILTEGSKKQGLGHIIRCIAVYDSFVQIGIEPYMYINCEDDLSDILGGFCYETFNWLKDRKCILKKINNSDVVIIDSYLADLDFYKEVSCVIKLPVYIDDNERIDYPKGIVLNFNIYGGWTNKGKEDKRSYILGTKYIPLRKVFVESLKENIIKSDQVKQILLMFGGNDVGNLAPQVLEILQKDKYSSIKKILISGKMTSEIEGISNVIDSNTEILYKPSPDIIAETMISSDMAISSAGMTLYELAYCQIPTIAIAVADNQRDGLNEFVKENFISEFLSVNEPDLFSKLENLMDFYIDNFSKVKQTAKIGRHIVDGLGSQRIASEIVNTFNNFSTDEKKLFSR